MVSIPLTEVLDRTIIPPYRLPRRALGERWKLRLPPEFLESVVFLCAGREKKPGGTAFFASVPDEINPKVEWVYLVTARHNLEEIPGQDIFVRLSTLDGSTFEHESTRKDDWFKHNCADVAAIPFSQEGYGFKSLPLYMFINKDYEYIPHQFGHNYERGFINRYGKLAVPVEL